MEKMVLVGGVSSDLSEGFTVRKTARVAGQLSYVLILPDASVHEEVRVRACTYAYRLAASTAFRIGVGQGLLAATLFISAGFARFEIST